METLLWPRGTVTFLFTDIEGSTALWERDRIAMREAVDRQLAILQSLITAHHGVLFKTIGDGTQAAFASAEEALRAAVASQRALLTEDWGDAPGPLRVRMAMHAGEAIPDPRGDYLAAPLNRLARLLSTGYGGQVLLSQAVQQLSRRALPAGSELQDLGEHRLRDLLEPERVYQLLHPDLPAEFPPLKTLDTRPNNLPLQPTPFLGRERELAEIAKRLRAPAVHLLSLTGPGGTGKTRLALQAAADLGDDFADGVFFVPLGAITDPELVPATIAEAVGIREAGGRPIRELLLAELCPKDILLVLDNFEQVRAGASVLADLLSACPHVKVLATSRVPLRLRAEQEYPVPPLPLPRRKPPPTAEQLSQFEAVRLFIERAQAVRPDFAVDNATAPVVAEICHRLDGLPLAIELAAARAKLLPPVAMLARLEQRLPLLTGGARDLPERQRTLRAAIAWSDDLLATDERALFRRLAVFAGGATFEAVEAVANPDGVLDTFDAIAVLVDHSLVRQKDGPGGEPRFTMLETIREYGLEQLRAHDEIEATRQWYATFLLTLAEAAELPLWTAGPDLLVWLDRLEADHDNLRAALQWALDRQPETALRMVDALERFWSIRSHFSEGRAWSERARSAGSTSAPNLRAAASRAAAKLAWAQGDYATAALRADESLALYREVGDKRGIARASTILGDAVGDSGDGDRAVALYEDALRLFREAGDDTGIAIVANNLGVESQIRGDLVRATELYSESLQLADARGDTSGKAVALLNLGEIQRDRGEVDASVASYRESLKLGQDLGDIALCVQCIRGLGTLLASAGRPEDAVRLLASAEGLGETLGFPVQPSEHLAYDRAIEVIRSALGDPGFTAAWTAGRALPLEEAIAETRAIIEETITSDRMAV
jgi:predicted ATPase/class 3 adenylate cyclase